MNVFLLHRRHRHMNLDISHKQKLNSMQLNHVLLFFFHICMNIVIIIRYVSGVWCVATK